MKKLFAFTGIMLMLFTVFIIRVSFAQNTDSTGLSNYEVIGGDTVWNPTITATDSYISVDYFKKFSGSLEGLAMVVLIIVGIIRKKAKDMSVPAIQITSWIIGPVVALLFMALKWGMFANLEIGYTLLAGILASVSANGIASIFFVKAIFSTVKR